MKFKKIVYFKLIVLLILLLNPVLIFGENDSYTIRLENGIDLDIKEHTAHRWLPHAYYDQALDSINSIYPENRILAKRRYGSVGNVRYSLIAYKDADESLEVKVKGVVVKQRLAWIFDTKVAEFKFNETMILILERISKLPEK